MTFSNSNKSHATYSLIIVVLTLPITIMAMINGLPESSFFASLTKINVYTTLGMLVAFFYYATADIIKG
jgi:hypothetical protein